MTTLFTTKIKEATYDYEVFNDLKNKSYWGEDLNAKVILGKDVPEELGLTLIPESGYIFRKTLKGGLLPARITIHYKTKANIMKGSTKYGSAKIMAEFK